MPELRNTLNERGGRYGRFDHHAGTARALIETMEERITFRSLDADMKHALCYIQDKIARILEGDPTYTDNWHDIAGYATLIEDRLNGTGIYAKHVVDSDTLEAGRCVECHAVVGDVHAPDCPQRTKVSPPGRSTWGG